MRFQPIDEEKANENSGASKPWPSGDYDFTVTEAAETESKAGNEMMKLRLDVFNTDGKRKVVFDYLINNEASQWKMRHFCDSIGILSRYERGQMSPDDCIGRSGRCTLRVKPARGEYEAGNQVGDYLPENATSGAPKTLARVGPPAKVQANWKQPADLDDVTPF